MRVPVSMLLLHADWILTLDGDRRVIADGAIAVDRDRIAAVGPTTEIASRYESPEVRSLRGKLVLPGLVDSHIHTAFHLIRGLADEVGSQRFLFERMYPYEGCLDEEESYWTAALCALEELCHGVTCMIDSGNYHPNETAEALGQAGVRAVMAKSAMDVAKSSYGSLPGTFNETTEEALSRGEEVTERLHGSYEGRIRGSLSFRGVNNASDTLIKQMKTMADERGVLFQAHAYFAKETRDSSVRAHGLTEVERLNSLGALGPNLLLIHMGWATLKELLMLRDHDVKVVAAASSSLHNGYGNVIMGKIPEPLEMEVSVGLGSDHASSGIVDLIQEMFLVSGGYKETRMDAGVMPPEDGPRDGHRSRRSLCGLGRHRFTRIRQEGRFNNPGHQSPRVAASIQPRRQFGLQRYWCQRRDGIGRREGHRRPGRGAYLRSKRNLRAGKEAEPSILEKTGRLAGKVNPQWSIQVQAER